MVLKNCIMTNSYNFLKARPITPTGIVVHSTGVNQKYIHRYVQPLATDEDAAAILADLGKNKYNNDYNHKSASKGVHAFIGLNANDEVCTYQVLPYTLSAFGVGNGTRVIGTKEDGTPQYGSYNYDPNARIQFEVCEDDLTDPEYFSAVILEAEEYCAELCKQFGWRSDKISSHKEAYLEGYGSNHADIDHWLKKFGMTMDDFRRDVEEMLPPPEPEYIYRVQVGAYSKPENAEKMMNRLKEAGFNAYVKKEIR